MLGKFLGARYPAMNKSGIRNIGFISKVEDMSI